jgi:periplasmic protein TonB
LFEFATTSGRDRGAGRRGVAFFVSGAIHGSILLVATIFAVAQSRPDEAPPVDVKFVKPGIKSAAPPPPPPPPPKKKHNVHTPNKIVAPVVMPEKPPDPKPEEKKQDEDDDDDSGSDDGVEGGVEGGVKGGVVGGVVGGVLGGQLGGVIDENMPVYAGAGYTKPRLENPNCLADTIKIPSELHGIVKTAVVKFAVGPGGQVSHFQMMKPQVLPDPRFEEAFIKGIRNCKWIEGTDAKGKSQTIWVVQPIRLE